jgi:hypothetical protein
MLRIALVSLLLLVACATTPQEPPVHGETAGHRCDNSQVASFIGRPATTETGSAIMKATNAGTLRWAWPDSALTMDFRTDRATVSLSTDGKVSKIDCG